MLMSRSLRKGPLDNRIEFKLTYGLDIGEIVGAVQWTHQGGCRLSMGDTLLTSHGLVTYWSIQITHAVSMNRKAVQRDDS